ncbi:MAG: hypothetical protein AAB223_05310, partial [Pseudomonadota bacterium]
PDLTYQTFTAQANNTFVGATVTLNSKALNKASANAGVTPPSFDSTFEVDPPGAASWTPIGTAKKLIDQTGTLAVGASRPITAATYTVPATAGAYNFRVCVDTPMPNGTVGEKIEGIADNCSAATPLTFTALPDLTYQTFTAQANNTFVG